MRLLHTTRPLVVIAATAMLIVGCGGGDSDSGSASSGGGGSSASASSGSSSGVTISDFKFSPASLSVKQGAQVNVTNDDSTAHTATADDDHSFDTGNVDSGSSQTITAPKPGSYPYHCSIHPFMHGTLVVK